MEPASLCENGTGEAQAGAGGQDIDEALAKLLLGHPAPAGAVPTGPTEQFLDSRRASVTPWVRAREDVVASIDVTPTRHNKPDTAGALPEP